MQKLIIATLEDLIAQKEALETQITEQHRKDLSEATVQIRALIDAHDLNAENIFGGSTRWAKSSEKPSTKVAAKYRDPISGRTWSGRGLDPKRLAGKNKEDFVIAA